MAAVASPTDPRATKLTITLVGGGSGGHITPLLAVAEELKKQHPNLELIYIGQTGDKLSDVPAAHKSIKQAYTIRAGKFRRYHGEGLKQLLDFHTMAKNIRDFLYFLIGTWQAFWLLGKIKPDVIFVKGGFVGVPVGLMAALRGIPYVTHDSDAIPGLANRIIAKWAAAHAVALPKQIYTYPPNKTFTVGVPVNPLFRKITKEIKAEYRKSLNIKIGQEVIFVSGGGNGAKRLNEAVIQAVTPLIKLRPQLNVIHATGRDLMVETKLKYQKYLNRDEMKRLNLKGFYEDLYLRSGAADIVVTRAGATSMAEFAIQQKCCIIVPNPILTAGHQTKNAQYMANQKAAVVLEDSDISQNPDKLLATLLELLNDSTKRQVLANNLASFAKPRAAKDLAQLLLETVE